MKKLLLILLCLPMLFSCENLINQNKMKNKADDLKEQKDFYISETKSDSTELSKLKNDSEEQEKFAREKFLIKKDNEDIFIIRTNETE